MVLRRSEHAWTKVIFFNHGKTWVKRAQSARSARVATSHHNYVFVIEHGERDWLASLNDELNFKQEFDKNRPLSTAEQRL